MTASLRASVAIAGAAESDLGSAPEGTRPIDLMAQASLRALADAGLTPADVDGVFAATTQLPMAPLNLALELGIEARYSDATNVGGASFMFHVGHARAAIAAGLCDVALIAYGSTQRLVGRSSASIQELDPWEAPFRPAMPVTAYALAASRHMYEFGTTREQLASVAVAARSWAALNPDAWSRDPLSVEDVLASRMVADPLTLRDCCLITDGGGAIVVTSAARAAALRRPPVLVLGTGEAHSHRHITGMPSLTSTAAARSGAAAFAQAGLTPGDVDVAQLYDAFTITPILFLEDLGFCAKGDGGPFAASGAIARGGSLPLNTNGGGLSYTHPGMYGLHAIVEAVRQLRGECGERQVADCEVAVAHGNGGVLSSQATVVLGTTAVL